MAERLTLNQLVGVRIPGGQPYPSSIASLKGTRQRTLKSRKKTMINALLLCLIQSWPTSRAELSNYSATSSFEDVISFVQTLEKSNSSIRMSFIGKSTEGRPIPMVIVSNPKISNVTEARRYEKLIVYIQANIHAGEVEGKEATLHLLRKIAKEEYNGGSAWLKNIVFIINPIYNADGNEKWGPVAKNRPEQDGPELVGVRSNGQGFDLNRDCIKAESPEMQTALANIYNQYDPDVVIDLHTTNGTRHGFDLTYSPPLNPNTDAAIMKYARDKLLPDVRKQMVKKFGKDLFDYGNGTKGDNPRWTTFEPLGRYVTNYAGLRGSIGILSEATTYIPFKDRILATEQFVTLILDHLSKNRNTILKLRKEFKLPEELGIEFALEKSRVEKVPIEKLEPGETKPSTGRPKKLEMIQMDVFDRFSLTKTAKVPFAYLIPETETKTIELLKMHGIVIKRIDAGKTFSGAEFNIQKLSQATQPFQGHKLIRIEGEYINTTVKANAGDYLVQTKQRLGGLTFWILEPESPDGAVAWGFLGENLSGVFPIRKVWK